MLYNVILSVPIVLLFCVLLYKCLLDFGLSPKSAKHAVLPEEGFDCRAAYPNEWKTFGFALGVRVLVMVSALFCIMIGSNEQVSLWDCLEKLRLWDANHYINLIDKGYSAYQENGEHLFLVFYPCYVWLVRIVKLIIPNTALAGALVSALCFSWGCCWVHKLAFESYDKSVADDAVLFLSVFPFSFFFGTVMTEGLFLLTTAAALYYAHKHKWLAFGIWGAFAALTRMIGILVVLPGVIEFFKSVKPLVVPIKASMKRLAQKAMYIPLLFLPCLGMLGYWLLNYLVDGNPFAYMIHQQHWYQGPMWVTDTLKYIVSYLGRQFQQSMAWAVWLPELILFIVFFAILVLSLRSRKNSSSILAYAFCYLIANYSLSWLLSGGRYLSCGFVFFILLAALVKNRSELRTYVIVVESLFLGIFLFGYVSGAQIM